MPSSIASLLTFIFVITLYLWDHRRNKDMSPALWLPVLWMLPAASRFPSQWLLLGDPAATSNVTDGSTTDAAYFLVLILWGGMILLRRHVVSASFIRQNFWFFAFLLFGLVSILWSDFQFVAFKRWVKILGHPIMAFIILTDANPVRALRVVMYRCAFILVPVSVLFIKYWPAYGRYFNYFDGSGLYRGVSLSKNELGTVCVIFGLFFLWRILARKDEPDVRLRREQLAVNFGFLGLTIYLLFLANSAASLVTFAIGTVTMIGLGMPFVSKRFFGTYFLAVIVVVGLAELGFGLYEQLIEALGKDPTLTDRTEVWADVFALQTRPWIGAGFESFWLGSRLEAMWAKWWWQPNQAHNGYVETYLNLGFIGVGLLSLLVVSAFRRITSHLQTDFEYSRFRLALLFAILAYNITEATFKGVALSWTMFHLVVLTYPRAATAAVKTPQATPRSYGQRVAEIEHPDGSRAKHGQTAHYRSHLR